MRRASPALLECLDRLYGQRPDPRPAWPLPRVFESALELPWEVRSAPALLTAADRLLHELQAYLRASASLPGLYLATRLFLAPILVIDRGLDPVAALVVALVIATDASSAGRLLAPLAPDPGVVIAFRVPFHDHVAEVEHHRLDRHACPSRRRRVSRQSV